MKTKIEFLTKDRLDEYVIHLHNHMSESGINNIIYTPFDIGYNHPIDKMKERITERFNLPIVETNWERAFIAVANEKIIGHLDLQGPPLESSLHRCKLGMGLNKEFRSQGIGGQLMNEAIKWITNSTTIQWLDLYTFEHNESAIALYQKFGFILVGKVEDLFRVNGQKITDYQMTLKINRENSL